ncbi:MAG: hypothetical protein COU90_04630 [Candidatus Ryanbacteria bacterium CG10_big_fil_rev_8_21_14_0_10_43_42]|uniref:Magnesium transport protein CorA n=1 Tax=Candidatus Ryanbacteria bacterium CG10_big_fil_rev_8_21_14_0_10_43_42 TaxID=1974864 RepID=A0A2M8KW39_9BACT|nr:MAG: hypothetical protein COU90_04630 [Candidatus Ryanbacteria bacterium CG10_big_fil_rev_8_21_14_0_10_43_42]
MTKTIHGDAFVWTHLKKPKEEDLVTFAQKHDIHPLLADELTHPTFRPKVEQYDNFLYLILHFPVYNDHDSNHGKEIDFLIGKDFLITTQYHVIPALEEFIETVTNNKRIAKQYLAGAPGELLYHLLSYLFTNALTELETMDKKITRMESRIFKEPSQDLIEDISILRREILDFRRTMQPQESILASFEKEGILFFGNDMRPYITRIVSDYVRVWHILENHKETIEALHETNASLISMRTAEITKNLTIMAFITFPLTLLASLFGMNTKTFPIVGLPHDFWIIIGIMFAGIVTMYFFFRHRGWI